MTTTKPLARITYAKVKAKARAAFLKGKLQCQKRDYRGGCAYVGPCAIGIALKPSVRLARDNSNPDGSWTKDTSIEVILEAGIVFAPKSDYRQLTTLQLCHDGIGGADDAEGLDALRRLLGIKKSEMAQ